MALHEVADLTVRFDAPDLMAALQRLEAQAEQYDALAFGLIVMDADGIVLAYNQAESRFAGIPPEKALGYDFFADVAPCTNNYLVAGRYEEESLLDEQIDYIFTVKMRPTRVRLRMLKNQSAGRQYLAVRWT